MLQRLEKWVDITNITGQTQRLYDRQLPNGYIDVKPGESVTLDAPVYARAWRRSWLQRTSQVAQPEPEVAILPEPEPEVKETPRKKRKEEVKDETD